MPSVLVAGVAAAGAVFTAVLLGPLRTRLHVFGVGRGSIVNHHGNEALRVIPGTMMCEDLHLEETTGQLFTACQDDREQHTMWFPPNLVYTDPKALTRRAVVRIDPKTFTSTKLKLKGFTGSMVTHGFDILNDPDNPEKLWIYVVSHLPNPERYDAKPPRSDLPPERPHIEIFSHILGTDEANYERAVRHPSIRMPNDIVAITPSSFYVTNDHIYAEGLMRTFEDVGTQTTGPVTDLMFVELGTLSTNDPTAAVKATTALKKIHNNNRLGRGRPSHPEEIVIIDATGGVMIRARRNDAVRPSDHSLEIIERIHLDSTLDNPSYYDDPWATPTNNASGYILPGLLQGLKMLTDFTYNDRPLPSCVWHVRANGGPIDFESGKNSWEKRLVFADDGKALRSASGAILIGIDPATNEGRKQGWLFVTGFG